MFTGVAFSKHLIHIHEYQAPNDLRLFELRQFDLRQLLEVGWNSLIYMSQWNISEISFFLIRLMLMLVESMILHSLNEMNDCVWSLVEMIS